MDDNMVLNIFFCFLFNGFLWFRVSKLSLCAYIKVSKAYSSHTFTATLLDVLFQYVAFYGGVMVWEPKRPQVSNFHIFIDWNLSLSVSVLFSPTLVSLWLETMSSTWQTDSTRFLLKNQRQLLLRPSPSHCVGLDWSVGCMFVYLRSLSLLLRLCAFSGHFK